MGLFENVPYTNFHDMNLDWIIKKIKEMQDKQSGIDAEIHAGIEQIQGTTAEGVETLNSGVEQIQESVTEGQESINDTLADAINRLENIVSNVTRRVILIGDSYFTRRSDSNLTIPEIVQNLIGYSSANFYHTEIAGGAFAHGETDHKFITLLQNLFPSVTFPDTITDIYVCCGANDVNYSYDANLQAMQEFSTYAKSAFPKARVLVVPWGITFKTEIMYYKDTRFMPALYRASEYGIIPIQNGKYLLYNSLLMESDRCHPNSATGIDTLARGLSMIIRTDSCQTHYAYTMAELGGTVTVDNLTSPLVLASYGFDAGRMARDNENVILSQCNNQAFLACVFNLNGQTFTPDNRIRITLNNSVATGRILSTGTTSSPTFNALLSDSAGGVPTGPAACSIEFNSNSNKYEIVIRPMINWTMSTNNNVMQVMISGTYTD